MSVTLEEHNRLVKEAAREKRIDDVALVVLMKIMPAVGYTQRSAVQWAADAYATALAMDAESSKMRSPEIADK